MRLEGKAMTQTKTERPYGSKKTGMVGAPSGKERQENSGVLDAEDSGWAGVRHWRAVGRDAQAIRRLRDVLAATEVREEAGVFVKMWRAFLSALNANGRIVWEESFADGTFASAKKGAPKSARPAKERARRS